MIASGLSVHRKYSKMSKSGTSLQYAHVWSLAMLKLVQNVAYVLTYLRNLHFSSKLVNSIITTLCVDLYSDTLAHWELEFAIFSRFSFINRGS